MAATKKTDNAQIDEAMKKVDAANAAKATVKKAEAVAKKAEPAKKTEPAKTVAAKKTEPAKKTAAAPKKAEPAKKTTTTAKKAEPAKKTTTTAKKTEPAKKAAAAPKKTASKEQVFLEWGGNKLSTEDIVEKVKAASSKKTIKELNLYVQPENNVVYYTADDEKGSIALF